MFYEPNIQKGSLYYYSSGFYLQTRKAKTLYSVINSLIIMYQDSIKKVRMVLNDSGKRLNRLSRVADFCYRTFRITQAFKLLLHAVLSIKYVNFAVTCNQLENLALKRLLQNSAILGQYFINYTYQYITQCTYFVSMQ